MSTPDDVPPPLDDELAGLLASLDDQAPPAGALDRVRARVDATLGLPPGGPPSSSGGDPPPASGSSAPSATATAAATATSRALLAKVAIVAFTIGAGVGVGVTRLVTETPQPVVVRELGQPSETPVSDALPALASPVSDAGVESADVRDASVVAPSPRDAGPPRPDAGEALGDGRDRVLADENALVTRAQSALARGRAGEALEALSEHQRRFPGGQFAEEREAMAIQALVRLGRTDAARARADRFRARFPGSMLLRAVEAAVGPAE